MSNHHKVGEKIVGDHPTVFELVLDEILPFVDPKKYGINDEKGINPHDYFITSGDAVEKAKVLEKNLWQYAGEIRHKAYELIAVEHKINMQEAQKLYRDGVRPTKPSKFAEFESAVWSCAGKSRSLKNALIKAKADNCFLETEWDNHRLLCLPKNPRR